MDVPIPEAVPSDSPGVPSDQNTPLDTQKAALSLVIPAWNEEQTILKAVREAHDALTAVTGDFEIIVVDDGSNDRTAEIVSDEMKNTPQLRLIQHPSNLGYSAALRSGFQRACFELVSFTDADCQFNLRNLEYMIPLAREYDIVSGYRIERKDPVRRRFYSWGYNTLVQLLMGSRVRDIDCALKIYHRDQLSRILAESNHFFGNTEMFTKAQSEGLSVVEVGVEHRSRAAGSSKVSIGDIPRTLSSLIPFWWSRVLFSNTDDAVGLQQSESQSRKEIGLWPALLLLILVAGVMQFLNLSYPLIEPDEGRYAEIAREMLNGGDWVVPHYFNEPYLDKPPLFYWLCAASYKVFGVNDWATRLVSACSALFTVLICFLFGRRLIGTQSAFVGSFVLAMSLGFVFCGRFVMLDSLLTAIVSFAVMAAYEAFGHNRWKWSWWLASAVATGLGVLAKGPVALALMAPPVVAYGWLTNVRTRPTWKQWAVYVGVIGCVAAPWYAAIVYQNPEFARYFFWEHNVSRFLGGANHPQPVWFYIPIVFLGFLPWALLLFPMLVFLFSRSKSLQSLRCVQLGYLVLWSGWCLLFFSMSSGKLPAYVLPAIPPTAMLLGYFLDHVCLRSSTNGRFRNTSYLMLRHGTWMLCAGGIVLTGGTVLLQFGTPWIAACKSALWTVTLIGFLVMRRRLALPATCGIFCVAAFFFNIETSRDVLQYWAYEHGALPPAEVVQRLREERIPIASLGRSWGSLPFYLGRDDVQNFNDWELEEFAGFVLQQPRSFVVVDERIKLQRVEQLLPEAELSILARSAKTKTLSVRCPPRKYERPANEPPVRFAAEKHEKPIIR